MRTISTWSPSRRRTRSYCRLGTTSPLTATAMSRRLTLSDGRSGGSGVSPSRVRGRPLIVTEIMLRKSAVRVVQGAAQAAGRLLRAVGAQEGAGDGGDVRGGGGGLGGG